MNTLTEPRTDQPPTVTRADRHRAFARLFGIALADPSPAKREAAMNAIRLWLQLRERCKESHDR
jgi:hypothetical protein